MGGRLGPGFISIPASTRRMRRQARSLAPEVRILQDGEEEEEVEEGWESKFSARSIESMRRVARRRLVVTLTLHTREDKVEKGSMVVVVVVESLLIWNMMVSDRDIVIV